MPTRAVKEKVICGHTYRVTLLGAKAGRAMLVRLLKLLGPTTAAFVEGTLAAKGGTAESLVTGAADAVREIAKAITEAEFSTISDELAKFTVVVIDHEREPQLAAVFEDHFAGRYDAMMQWFAFALEANFASFLGGSDSDAQPLAKRLQTLIASLLQSQVTSTGTSTESPQANATPQA